MNDTIINAVDSWRCTVSNALHTGKGKLADLTARDLHRFLEMINAIGINSGDKTDLHKAKQIMETMDSTVRERIPVRIFNFLENS